MIAISLCLSDIPKDKIKKAANGKHYVNLILSERKEKGKYGETHALMVSKTKDEREAKADTVYVGSGTLWEEKVFAPTPEAIADLPAADDFDDLPF
ncbi:MAG: hypothetical protein LBK94_12580 [Prevotellaceae bacterium]|jgi:hypothetical protein|nr:hypothetical protein [Prevotellaceae bacterium]